MGGPLICTSSVTGSPRINNLSRDYSSSLRHGSLLVPERLCWWLGQRRTLLGRGHHDRLVLALQVDQQG